MENIADISAPVILVAAGRGNRAGGGLPKQYQLVASKPLLRLTIENLQKSPNVADILCVIHRDDIELYNKATAGLSLLPPVFGGETRQESALSGLKALDDPSHVMIHDAARPFVPPALITRLVTTQAKGAIPGIAITDTVKRTDMDAKIIGTIDRNQLFTVQTPQFFHYETLVQAYSNLDVSTLTDDAMIMEAAGHSTVIIKGDPVNFKVTNPEDFKKAEAMMMNTLTDIRTGHGYDVHRFKDGDHVILNGIRIPHTHALKGHSDADVAMHALTDALLSLIAAGDIGTHFPPSDPQWKGAPSDIFLKKACDLIADKGGMISNMVVTIICEGPKIGPHREAMRAKLAEITTVPVDRISVQATTTEKLGFTGRNEGIAAEAVATVRLPL